MIESSPLAAIVCDALQPDCPIIECNEPFLELTGYTRQEVVGRNCRFLAGPDTEPAARQAMRDGIAARRTVLIDLLNYRKDGTIFRNAVMIVPLFDEDGELRYFLGSQAEIETGSREARTPSARQKVEALSQRHRDILVRMASGKLNKQIAYELDLSERTVKMHRAALFRALGVQTSAEAIRIAVEAGY